MNLKNKIHTIYLEYLLCLQLKKIGIPQQHASAYWNKTDKQVYQADRVTKFKGWESIFTAALTAEDLQQYLPSGSKIEKLTHGVFSATHPAYSFSGVAPQLAGSIARFMIHLHKHGKLKI